MSIQSDLLVLRSQAMRGDRTNLNIIRYLLGAFEQANGQPMDDKQAISLIRSLLKDADGSSTFSPQEVSFMHGLVPTRLDAGQVSGILQPSRQSILEAGSAGQAIGLAMKLLDGQPVDGRVVAGVVNSMRSTS